MWLIQTWVFHLSCHHAIDQERVNEMERTTSQEAERERAMQEGVGFFQEVQEDSIDGWVDGCDRLPDGFGNR